MSLPRSLKISKIAEVKKGALFSRSARKRRFRHAERASKNRLLFCPFENQLDLPRKFASFVGVDWRAGRETLHGRA